MTTRELFLRFQAQTSNLPLGLEIASAHGCWLTTTDDKKYLDLISGVSVSNIGHRHSAVIEAIHDQSSRYLHTMVYGEYAQEPTARLAQSICSMLDSSLDNVYFTNSGAEATEGAMKLAKRYTQRPSIIYCRHAYHGSTQGALSVMGSPCMQDAFRPLLPDTTMISFNDFEALKNIRENTAAIIIEPIQAEAGVIEPLDGYLQAVRKRCDEVGALMILDEIQTGFGRTGTMWAHTQYEVVPDILLLAKGMGGGLPIGAFVAPHKIMKTLTHKPVLGHITTFGGNALCAAAALAVVHVLQTTDYIAHVKSKALLFKDLLQHAQIKSLRQAGFMMALEFDNFDTTKKIIDLCLAGNLITDWFLFADNCLRIAPPLIINEDEIAFACDVIIHSINKSLK